MGRFLLFIVGYDSIGEVVGVKDVESESDAWKSAYEWIDDLPAVQEVIIWKAIKGGKFEKVNGLMRVEGYLVAQIAAKQEHRNSRK